MIGIGNEFRGDDAVGLLVARELVRLGVKAIEHHGEGASLIEAWQGHDSVILVDCMRSGAAVGTMRRFDVADTPLPAECMMASSHLFGVGQAVEMARLLGRLPRRMSIIGIEGRNFEYGAAVESAVVAAATSMVLGDGGF